MPTGEDRGRAGIENLLGVGSLMAPPSPTNIGDKDGSKKR